MGDSKANAYRQYLPDLSIPRFTTMATQDAHVYANAFLEGGKPPWIYELYQHWKNLLKAPYKGITNDGKYSSTVPHLQSLFRTPAS